MTYLNVDEVEAALGNLAAAYPGATQLVALPFLTAEGRRSHALRLGAGGCVRTSILLVSGTHAREWGGPDILVNLAADLLEAWSTGTGLTYGGTSFTSSDVKSILHHVELVVFPLVNPDGMNYSHRTYAMWRKNRNPASSGGSASRIGVDVNRNYDFLWNFPTAFAPAAQNAGTLASIDPASDLFHGTAPFSEAESSNVRWLFDRFPNISRYIDLHSYTGTMLHPWGDDSNQSSTPSMNFTNAAWNGKRGVAADQYGEYIAASDLSELQSLATATTAAIKGVRGESYSVAQAFFLPGWPTYPTSGASEDWAFSRHYANPLRRKVLGYTIEFNKTIGQFFPPWSEMEKHILDVDAGLVRFCREGAPRYSWWLPCWWRDWLLKLFRRLFPPDLWGPYGPWGRIREFLGGLIRRVAKVVTRGRSTG